LAQEGLPLEIVDVEKVPATTVSIYPDAKKDVAALDIAIPRLTAGNQTLASLGPIALAEVQEAFTKYPPLPLGASGPDDVQYEGRHLITGQVVEHMKVHLALLESGYGAVSFFVQELEHICKVKGTHQVVSPLIEKFLEELLFGRKVSLFDAPVIRRLGDSDVREYVRAVFVPLIRSRIVQQQVRAKETTPVSVASWRPFQVTVSERRPGQQSVRTVFNLIPCNRSLETAFVELCSKSSDVAAFAKNAGPQCLRVDYLSDGMRLAFYTPDFFVRMEDGNCFLVETKGQVDKDVPLKARAATEWCKAASAKQPVKWSYVFVPEGVFQRFQGSSFSELVRMCSPALNDLLNQEKFTLELPLFAGAGIETLEPQRVETQKIVDEKVLNSLPERFRKAAEEAVSLFQYFEKKEGVSYAPVFTALLGVVDEAARGLVLKKLNEKMPGNMQEQREWFEPYLAGADRRMIPHYQQLAQNLRKTLVYRNGVSPLGLLRSCLDYALNDHTKLTGVFEAIKTEFRFSGGRNLLDCVKSINDLRNTRIAHQEAPLADRIEAKKALIGWVEGLSQLWRAGLQ
jgi:type III restriction enzyme